MAKREKAMGKIARNKPEIEKRGVSPEKIKGSKLNRVAPDRGVRLSNEGIIRSIEYKNIYFVLSLKRTAHHAISNWLCQQTKNDSIAWTQVTSPRNETKLLPADRARYYNGSSPSINYGPRCRLNFEDMQYSFVHNCIISTESFGYVENNLFLLEDILKLDILALNPYIIINNRDFFNWAASYFKNAVKFPIRKSKDFFDNRYRMRRVWKEFIRESLCPNVLKEYNVVDLNFTKWFSDKTYRCDLCDRLDLDFTDNGLNEATSPSSFDDLEYNDRAQQMDVLHRYPYILSLEGEKKVIEGKTEDVFQEYINLIDDEVLDLSQRYFRFIPDEIRERVEK